MTTQTREFATGAMRCRWQVLTPAVRAQDIAAAWLRDIAGDAIAAGLHRDPRDRPRLARGDIGWSHSHGRLLIAYSGHGRIGVDIESRARHTDPLRIGRRYFAAEEIDALESLDGEALQSAFLRLWCAKEAVLKAHGHGLSFGMHRLSFDATGQHLRMLRCDPALGRVDDWTLHELAPESEFIAVLASSA